MTDGDLPDAAAPASPAAAEQRGWLQPWRIPAGIGLLIGVLFRIWYAALYSPPGSYAIMPASAVLFFVCVLLLVAGVIFGVILSAFRSTRASGKNLLVIDGSAVGWIIAHVVSVFALNAPS